MASRVFPGEVAEAVGREAAKMVIYCLLLQVDEYHLFEVALRDFLAASWYALHQALTSVTC